VSLLHGHYLFIKKRLKPHIWLIASVIICYVGHDFLQLSVSYFIFVMLYFLSFRYLDEWGSFSYDSTYKKRNLINKNLKPQLLLISIALSFASILFISKSEYIKISILITFVVITSIILYKLLANNKYISLVSLLKYPAIFYAITQNYNRLQIITFSIMFFIYFIYEYKTEIIGHKLLGDIK